MLYIYETFGWDPIQGSHHHKDPPTKHISLISNFYFFSGIRSCSLYVTVNIIQCLFITMWIWKIDIYLSISITGFCLIFCQLGEKYIEQSTNRNVSPARFSAIIEDLMNASIEHNNPHIHYSFNYNPLFVLVRYDSSHLKLNTMQLVTPDGNHCCRIANDV